MGFMGSTINHPSFPPRTVKGLRRTKAKGKGGQSDIIHNYKKHILQNYEYNKIIPPRHSQHPSPSSPLRSVIKRSLTINQFLCRKEGHNKSVLNRRFILPHRNDLHDLFSGQDHKDKVSHAKKVSTRVTEVAPRSLLIHSKYFIQSTNRILSMIMKMRSK